MPFLPHRPERLAWLLTLSALLLVFGPRLLTPGTHVDGTTYAILARNLAQGKGSSWHLHYSQPDGYWLADSRGDYYVDNPPLGIWLEAGIFHLLGDHWWIEELVTGLWLFVISFFLVRCWRVIHPDGPNRDLAWLPILWLGTGFYTRYCLSGNLLELPLLGFGTFGLYQLLRALLQNRTAGWYWGGLAIFGGILTKGPFILFFWLIPLLYFLLVGRDRVTPDRGALARSFGWGVVKPTALLVGIPVALFLVGMTDEPFRLFWSDFFERQVLRSLTDTREDYFSKTVDPWGRWFVWKVLLVNLAPPLLLTAAILISGRRQPGPALRKLSYFFLALGVCGLLPVCLTARQNPQYAFASMPAWVLGLSIWHAPALTWLSSWRLSTGLYRTFVFALAVGTVLGVGWQVRRRVTGNNPRQNELIEGISQLRRIPRGSVVATLDAQPIRNDWFFNLLMNRCHGVELTLNRYRTPYLVAYRVDSRNAALPRLGYRPLEITSDSLYCFWIRPLRVPLLAVNGHSQRPAAAVALEAVEVQAVGQRAGVELLRVDARVHSLVAQHGQFLPRQIE